MIYCIGHAETYDRNLTNGHEPAKKGKCDGYPGGSVWETYELALAFADLRSGYKVYGVLANWYADTERDECGKWHNLLKDSPLVQVDSSGRPI